MANDKIRNLKVFKRTFEVPIRTFAENGKEKSLSKLFLTLRFKAA